MVHGRRLCAKRAGRHRHAAMFSASGRLRVSIPQSAKPSRGGLRGDVTTPSVFAYTESNCDP
jgi:hypothetical protein